MPYDDQSARCFPFSFGQFFNENTIYMCFRQAYLPYFLL